MNKQGSVFGWKSLFHFYGIKSLCLDSAIPFILAVIVCVGTDISQRSALEMLEVISNLAIDIVPAMIGLVLAAYTVLLSFIISEPFKKVCQSDDGKKFVKGLNAGFAACLVFLAISILLSILVRVCIEWNFCSAYADCINIITLGILTYFLIISVTLIFGIIIDIFNSGQTTTLL